MTKRIALILVLTLFITGISFGGTSASSTFKSQSEVYGMWMFPDSLDGFFIDKTSIYAAKRQLGTDKVTYLRQYDKPRISEDKKVAWIHVSGYTNMYYTIRKDAKGNKILSYSSGEAIKGAKHFATNQEYEKYLKNNQTVNRFIKNEKATLDTVAKDIEIGGYHWLKIDARDFDIRKTTNIEEVMSAYGPSEKETENWKIAVSGSCIAYAKDGFQNMTNAEWDLDIQSDAISIVCASELTDTELAIMSDALKALYPKSAKIEDIINRIIKDVKGTKMTDNLGYTGYNVGKIEDRYFTLNGIKVEYGIGGNFFQVVILK